MKAALVTRYGSPDVVSVGEAPKPTPAAHEILIRVHAASVNRTDCGVLRAHPFFMRVFTGLLRPRRTIIGVDLAGEVEAVGAATVSFETGDRVFGMCPLANNGPQAEYVCVPETAVAAIPSGTRFDEAVLCEGAFYAHGVLEGIGLQAGQAILIYGASGAIGTAMTQLAKAAGAVVTAVVATRHLGLAISLGADRVVDYTAEDFTNIGQTFDFVVDAVGKTSFFQCRRLLTPDGVFAVTDFGAWGQNVALALWSWITRRRRVVFVAPMRIAGFATFIKELMEAGQFRAVVDRRYTLAEIAEAYRYVESGQKVGIVVIDVVAADTDLAKPPEVLPARCANCGAKLQGAYCHGCGQPVEAFDRPIGSLLAEGMEHLLHADFRLFDTLPKLILKPDVLTREYLAGRRYEQTPPLRLFLMVVLIVFLAGGLREMARPFGPLIRSDAPTHSAPGVPQGDSSARAVAAWLEPRLAYAEAHPREFGMAVEGWLHRIAIIFLPISTLLLGLLFVTKRGVLLYDHAVFSMHSLSFMGLLYTAMTLLSLAGPVGGLAGPLVFAAPVHLFVHLRGAYRTSIAGTLVRMLLLFVMSAIAIALLFIAVFALELNGMGTART